MSTRIAVLTIVPVLFAASWLLPDNAAAQQEMAKSKPKVETAIFAGGCFWCVEANFEKVDGVISAVSGYTGGHVKNPTYEQVGSHTTGHRESVKVYLRHQQVDLQRSA